MPYQYRGFTDLVADFSGSFTSSGSTDGKESSFFSSGSLAAAELVTMNCSEPFSVSLIVLILSKMNYFQDGHSVLHLHSP